MQPGHTNRGAGYALYTDEERSRRDASPWTLVQGVLAPLQFFVFLAVVTLRSLSKPSFFTPS